MTQVSPGKGSWAGVALPVRVHDLLLVLAGRLDDDALADARELLASAEVDRALELVAGCVVAGPVGVSKGERDELLALFALANADPTVVERLRVVEPDLMTRHRFGVGKVDGVGAEQGVSEAIGKVLEALPDIRAVWAVWRLTPSGAATGAVPHRVVLIGVGPTGSAAATAYRVEHALRRAGLTASVEVLRDGTEPTDYHHTAMRYATEVHTPRKNTTVVAKPTPPKPWAAGPTEDPDESLNDQELGLLRQLQEELARREQGEPDLNGQPYDWHDANTSTMVNGVPLPPDNLS
ncbi:hypothetical protein [Actinokineospora inagensis]|uniref:hypothetical protein n=1 Tax=Actinokineospora inagensis TaxID=103730 RepID=UPI000419B897|nr:hypothetical protein [Actinokineospora inagensis]